MATIVYPVDMDDPADLRYSDSEYLREVELLAPRYYATEYVTVDRDGRPLTVAAIRARHLGGHVIKVFIL